MRARPVWTEPSASAELEMQTVERVLALARHSGRDERLCLALLGSDPSNGGCHVPRRGSLGCARWPVGPNFGAHPMSSGACGGQGVDWQRQRAIEVRHRQDDSHEAFGVRRSAGVTRPDCPLGRVLATACRRFATYLGRAVLLGHCAPCSGPAAPRGAPSGASLRLRTPDESRNGQCRPSPFGCAARLRYLPTRPRT